MTRPENDNGFRHLGMEWGRRVGRAHLDPQCFVNFNESTFEE